MTKKPWLIDTTLRDGEQSPGVVFSSDEKIRLVEKLQAIGIAEIELPISPAQSSENEDIKRIVALNSDCRLTGWCRADTDEIVRSYHLGLDAVHISFPVSDLLLGTMGKDRSWVLSELRQCVMSAAQYFPFISVGAMDAGRADNDFLFEFIGLCVFYGAGRLRYADTVGSLEPVTVYNRMKNIRLKYPDLSIDFHAHNDLGMATANAVSAYLGGADALSLTVNGLGERSGNAALEEVVLSLMKSCNIQTGIHIEMLADLCSFTAGISGDNLSGRKPIVGRNNFRHESGIHCRSLIENCNSFELIHPEEVGAAHSEFVIGKHSGKAAIRYLLKKKGITVQNDVLSRIVSRVKELSIQMKSPIPEETLVRITDLEMKKN